MTHDGGESWAALPALRVPLGFAARSPSSVTGLYFANATSGYLFGPGLELSHDGGRTWSRSALPPVVDVTGGGGYAYAVSETSAGGFRVWRNAAGSNRWAAVSLPGKAVTAQPGGDGFDLEAAGSTLLLLRRGPTLPFGSAGRGALWTSSDGGREWLERPVPCARADGGATVVGIALGHPESWLVDCFDNMQSSQAQHTQHHLYGTADAGASWTRLADPAHDGDPDQLADNGSGHAFLTTESGGGDRLAGSFDGARHWSTLFRSGGAFFGWADLRFVSASTGFVVGPTHNGSEHLYRTDDGGHTWHVLPLRPA